MAQKMKTLTRANVTIEGFGRITVPLKLVPSVSGGNMIAASENEKPETWFKPRYWLLSVLTSVEFELSYRPIVSAC
jgi:hypothetical protein